MRVISVCQASAMQVVHQLDVLLDIVRDAIGPRGQLHIAVHALAGLRDASLDLAHIGEEAIQALAVGRRQRAIDAPHLLRHRVEQAQRLRAPRRALRIIGAVAKQLLEHRLRIVLHRQRRELALPGQRIAVGA